MARIMKIRVVPRGYVPLDDEGITETLRRLTENIQPSELFMGLFYKFGKPMGEPYWYMLRHGNVILRITMCDSVEYGVYVSPGHVQEARRKQTKVMNVIARRLNEAGVVFVPGDGLPDALYYAVRKKNAELMQKGCSTDTDKALTDEERVLLYGGLSQYLPEVASEVENILNYINNG